MRNVKNKPSYIRGWDINNFLCFAQLVSLISQKMKKLDSKTQEILTFLNSIKEMWCNTKICCLFSQSKWKNHILIDKKTKQNVVYLYNKNIT